MTVFVETTVRSYFEKTAASDRLIDVLTEHLGGPLGFRSAAQAWACGIFADVAEKVAPSEHTSRTIDGQER